MIEELEKKVQNDYGWSIVWDAAGLSALAIAFYQGPVNSETDLFKVAGVCCFAGGLNYLIGLYREKKIEELKKRTDL